MEIQNFFISLLNVVCEMAPYLLLGFLIAGVLHVFVPQRFYANYLSQNNKFSVVWAALLGVPLPLCSCGVIPTAIGLRNEKASKGAIASFLIATPQTGIDSILATFSLMGLGFAIIRPTAALITGVCGGLLVNRLVKDEGSCSLEGSSQLSSLNSQLKIWRVLKYAYYDMLRDIGLRLLIGLIVAALIQVAIPDEFFLSFGSQPLLQMLAILVIAVPMYICSTGSIPVAAALMMKGLSPGAALVMLMAGPAVNMASILVVHKSMGRRFTSVYLMTIVGFAILFGLLLNATGWDFTITNQHVCCMNTSVLPSPFKLICATVLTVLIIFALMMKFFSKFTSKKTIAPDITIYRVEDMHCSHCEAAVVRAVEALPGVENAKASASANTLTIKGSATEETIRAAVEGIGYTFKGRNH
ncbi:MAG: heavy metal-associated domain-containing protein [Prevotella ruminicola]|jgi:hypothetical protein|uniref:Heavy metal-associated domain-containing protein n=1 Tax=Xylanibacter ruminicola TaxID=839 RepID=A0A9D5NYN9_XYLRU|nr:heavy metal-associated domain-containing protein [Xylanibacter ruminicola]